MSHAIQTAPGHKDDADRAVSFSMLLPLPSEIEPRVVRQLIADFSAKTPDGIMGFDATPSIEPPGLYLGSDDGDTEQLIAFIRDCADRFGLTGLFGFFYSTSCLDMRPGGFSSSAVVLDLGTGQVLDAISTDEWLQRRVGGLPSVPDAAAHRLDVRPFTSEDSYGFELFDPETSDVAAVVHDGMDRPLGQARGIADILAAAPVMLVLLNEALAFQGEAFDQDQPVGGGDLVDQIGNWRHKVKSALGLPALMGMS